MAVAMAVVIALQQGIGNGFPGQREIGFVTQKRFTMFTIESNVLAVIALTAGIAPLLHAASPAPGAWSVPRLPPTG